MFFLNLCQEQLLSRHSGTSKATVLCVKLKRNAPYKQSGELLTVRQRVKLSTPNMSTVSIYNAFQEVEKDRDRCDIIRKVLFAADMTLLGTLLLKLHSMVEKGNFSERWRQMWERLSTDNVRISKHAMLFFGIYLSPEFAESFIRPKPLVNPNRFRQFHATTLHVNCQKLLNGEFISLQGFVEVTRHKYNVYMG